jgi:DNA-binding NarL/FixJ family response regulator
VKSVPFTREAEPDGRIRVAVVAQRPSLRHALAALLSSHADILPVGEAAGAASALALVAETRPDVVVMDLSMPRMDGLRTTTLIKQRFHRVRVIALSPSADAEDLARAACADASIPKGDPGELLLVTIRDLMRPR